MGLRLVFHQRQVSCSMNSPCNSSQMTVCSNSIMFAYASITWMIVFKSTIRVLNSMLISSFYLTRALLPALPMIRRESDLICLHKLSWNSILYSGSCECLSMQLHQIFFQMMLYDKRANQQQHYFRLVINCASASERCQCFRMDVNLWIHRQIGGKLQRYGRESYSTFVCWLNIP